ncbi:MAG: glutamate--tRNA ligase [Deltaproteobacteria bacterium]|nr:glutamate--tRNA ligase [Deltaproteobacteria bacterium]
MPEPVRVRFAPSPTGYLHIGGARTALFNFLFARHHGGTFILRIEDTDRTRYQEGALQEIFESLRWLGLPWDEGPEVGGPFGPYFQSERLEIYRRHAADLVARGAAYRCFCTPERLDQVRKEQEKAKVTTKYDRRCRALSQGEERKLLDAGTPHVVRLRVPDGRAVMFDDLIRGEIVYQSDVLDDLVLLKSDGYPTYHLANVVDDHLMRITHVLRGDEWIASTPRHILLYEAFGWAPPVFAHMPVILSPDGGKLSKRKGAASVTDYRRAGYLPQALLNFLAFLGWNPGDEREVMTREEIVHAFGLEKVNPKAAVLDEVKLEWMNHEYMRKLTIDEALALVLPMWKGREFVGAGATAADSYLRAVAAQLKDRSKRLTELADNAAYFFREPGEYEEAAAKKQFKPEAAALLCDLASAVETVAPFDHASLEEKYRALAESRGVGAAKLIHPTRLAVSGLSYGPGLFELMEIIGKDKVVARMRRAAEWIRSQSQKD